MGLEFYFMGDVWCFCFPKIILDRVMSSISIYDHTLGNYGPKRRQNYYVNVTVSSKDSGDLKSNIKKDFNSFCDAKFKKSFKAIKVGRKYELRLPEKEYQSFKALMKARGCRTEKISRNEGDGNINIFIIIPYAKVLSIKTIVLRYAKKNGF